MLVGLLQRGLCCDEVGDIGDRADETSDADGCDHLLRKKPDRAICALSSILETHGPRLQSEVGPRLLHSGPIRRVHALGPVVQALLRCQGECAPIRWIGVRNVARGVGVINRDGSTLGEGSSDAGERGRGGCRSVRRSLEGNGFCAHGCEQVILECVESLLRTRIMFCGGHCDLRRTSRSPALQRSGGASAMIPYYNYVTGRVSGGSATDR